MTDRIHGHGTDRRPWLIISKREAEAVLLIIRDYIGSAPNLPGGEDPDLVRAERVITNQLAYITSGVGDEPNVTTTLIREQRS